MRTLITILSIAVFFAILSCSTVPLEYAHKQSERDDAVIFWVHSDIQPRNNHERKQYESAVRDVNKNIGAIDFAIVAGDIIQGAPSGDARGDYKWFNKVRSTADVVYWYEIAGNHDGRFMKEYRRNIKKPLHYSVLIGNMLIIFMSDEDGATSGTEISEGAFLWWKDLVENNQNKIIITVTHTNLSRAGFGFSVMPYREIHGSKRFEKVLGKYRVDVWISGHTHTPSKLNLNEVRPELSPFHTLFLNVASIREDFFLSEVESRFLVFKKGSPFMTVKTRYHNKEEFVDMREFSIKLSHSFEWDGKAPIMNAYRKLYLP